MRWWPRCFTSLRVCCVALPTLPVILPPPTCQIIERDETRTASRKAGQLEAAPHPAPPPAHLPPTVTAHV